MICHEGEIPMANQKFAKVNSNGQLTIRLPHLRGKRVQLVETPNGVLVQPLEAVAVRQKGISAFIGQIWPAAEYISGNHRIKA